MEFVFQSRKDNVAMDRKNKLLKKPGHTTVKQVEKEDETEERCVEAARMSTYYKKKCHKKRLVEKCTVPSLLPYQPTEYPPPP